MIMPIGKYKGDDIEDVPSNYLKWVAENWDEDGPYEEVRKACEDEYDWRTDHNKHFWSERRYK